MSVFLCLCVCLSVCVCLSIWLSVSVFVCGAWQDLTLHTPLPFSPFLSLSPHPHFPSPSLPSALLRRFSLASALTCCSSRQINILQEGRQPVRPQASALHWRRPRTSRHLQFLSPHFYFFPPFFFSLFIFSLPPPFFFRRPPCIRFLIFGCPHYLYVAVATSECTCDFGGCR